MASRLQGVLADEVKDWLPLLREAFDMMAARSGGRMTAGDIVNAIQTRDMQLWLVVDGKVVECVFLTEIVRYPRRTALRFTACVGRGWRKWAHLREQVKEWGREQGCDLFEAYAPRKWRHLFTEMREFHVMMECDDNGR